MTLNDIQKKYTHYDTDDGEVILAVDVHLIVKESLEAVEVDRKMFDKNDISDDHPTREMDRLILLAKCVGHNLCIGDRQKNIKEFLV